ncbi:MAG TPA: c-type cytochrome [Terriglobia bacterium]|jgi:cytochrome c oxidase cbb3-type subunit 3
MNLLFWIAALLIMQQSPASQAPPKTVTPQSYPREAVLTGQARFVEGCSFCHGQDAAGSDTGPDLTRSILVAQDLKGDKIIPVVRQGRVDKGMPAFDLSDADLNAIVAYIHDQKTKAESEGGGRRSVDVTDIATGNAEAGARYFNGAGKCSTCHSPTGDLAGIGARYRGLPLLQRMLYPQGSRPAPAPAKVTVTLASGEVVTGTLASRDEFTLSIKDASGAARSWPVGDVKFSIDDPLAAHFDQLGKYSDEDMHNVYAYLQTLR